MTVTRACSSKLKSSPTEEDVLTLVGYKANVIHTRPLPLAENIPSGGSVRKICIPSGYLLFAEGCYGVVVVLVHAEHGV